MKQLKLWLVIALLGVGVTTPASAADNKPLEVVASFSILADMVRQIGGTYVDVVSLVNRNSDTHTWSPNPAAAKAVATADVVVVNGLGFEGWMDRLIQASSYDGPVIVVSHGVDPLSASVHEHQQARHRHEHEHGHDHENDRGHHHEQAQARDGKYNPHAWLSAANGVIYVRNIADALSKVDPAHTEFYREQAQAYVERLMSLHERIKSMVASLPKDQRTVVVPHSAFGYFSHAYGIEFLAPIGLSTAAAAGAGELAAMIETIRAKGIDAIFTGNITDPRLVKQIARETGATIQGTLYSDALSQPGGPASTYVQLLRYDATEIVTALAQ